MCMVTIMCSIVDRDYSKIMLTSSAYHMPLVMHIMHSGKDLSEFFFQFLTRVFITVSSFNLWLVDQVYVKQKSSAIVFVREFMIFLFNNLTAYEICH